jgi:hypothetical protein
MVYCARSAIDAEVEAGVGLEAEGCGMEVGVAVEPIDPTGVGEGGWVEQAAKRDKIQKQTANCNNLRWPCMKGIVNEKVLVESETEIKDSYLLTPFRRSPKFGMWAGELSPHPKFRNPLPPL